jgi:hypothetical protein
VLTRTLTSLTTCVIIAALSGCTDAEADRPDLEETTDASASDPTEYIPASEEGPAENVPEPQFPVHAKENTMEGAEASLEYFWQGVDYLRLTGDGTHAEKVSSDGCDLCSDLISGWASVYEGNSWAVLHGEMDLEIREVNIAKLETSNRHFAEVSFTMTEPPVDFFEEGRLLEDESFDTASTAEWWAELAFDGTAQTWRIEWVGLESHLSEDET